MNIINFGSLNIDYVYQVNHIVEGGATIEAFGYDRFCGGKGLNQSIAIARAGAHVIHIGAIGEDGNTLVNFLSSCGVDTDQISIVDKPTGHAIVQVDHKGQNSIIIFGGANREITRETVERSMQDFSAGDYITLQNEISNVPMIMRKAHEKGLTVFYNPSPLPTDLQEIPFECVDYLFVNETEGRVLSGETDSDKIIQTLRERYPACAIVLTLGKSGVHYAGPEGDFTHGIYQVPVVDTTAAGDTFCGFFIASLSRGESVPKALEIASKASSLCVSRKGAAPSIPTIEEVNIAALKAVPEY